ncbi:MAG: glycosyltransferase family 9 protein [Desulfohalobiaceae bacterium]
MARHLVIQLARFGDILQTKRLVASLARQPGEDVHILVDHGLTELTRRIYPGCTVHGITAHAGLEGVSPADCLSSVCQTLERVATASFHSVFNLNYSGLSFALASCFDPGQVRGYVWRSGQPMGQPWASMAVRWTRFRRRAGINLMDFWAGYAPDMASPETVNPPALPGGRGVGVVLSGRNARRTLPAQTMAALAVAVARRVDRGSITLFGTSADSGAAGQFRRHLPRAFSGQVNDLTGKTALSDLPEALTGLDLLLTPDTGTMHLAAHLGVPVEALFTASAWCFETGPYGTGHRVWQSVVDCAPCLEGSGCARELVCREPFADTRLLRRLSSGKGEIPSGLVLLESCHDLLGADYQVLEGCDPARDDRGLLRKAVSRYLLGDAVVRGGDASGRLYRERDWMLGARGGDLW